MERLNITLDDEQAEKLARLADRMHIQPGTVAPSLLASALDEADADARDVAALLDGIPGARALSWDMSRRTRARRSRSMSSTSPWRELSSRSRPSRISTA